jgi:hypothetical protein
MKTLIMLVCLLCTAPALANTLDFEVGGQSVQLLNFVDGDYAGAQWDLRWGVLDQQDYATRWGSTLAFPSGEHVLFNAWGTATLFIDAQRLDLTGAWFAPWTAHDQWYDPYSAHSVTIEGWTNGTFVGSDTLALDPAAFRYLATDFGPVEQLRIRADVGADHIGWFLMDNMNVTITPRPEVQGVASVPEPSSLFFVLTALLASVLGWSWLRLWRHRLFNYRARRSVSRLGVTID